MMPSKLFEEVLERPGMYTSAGNSVIEIAAFMNGYIIAIEEMGLNSDGDAYYGFQQWVERKYNIEPVRGWQHIVAYMSPNESYALKQARELWADYKAQTSSRDKPYIDSDK